MIAKIMIPLWFLGAVYFLVRGVLVLVGVDDALLSAQAVSFWCCMFASSLFFWAFSKRLRIQIFKVSNRVTR